MSALRPRTKRLLAGAAVVIVAGAVYWGADELQSSRLQAELIGQLAKRAALQGRARAQRRDPLSRPGPV